MKKYSLTFALFLITVNKTLSQNNVKVFIYENANSKMEKDIIMNDNKIEICIRNKNFRIANPNDKIEFLNIYLNKKALRKIRGKTNFKSMNFKRCFYYDFGESEIYKSTSIYKIKCNQ